MSIERHKIENHLQWMGLRQKDVTASAAGSLLGVHPYITAYGLYLSKAGLISDDMEETPVLRRGRLLEPVAVQMLREDKPDWTIHNHPVGYYYRDPDARIGATPDVLATNEHGKLGIVQIKSVEPSIFRRDWKNEDGATEPPLWIVCQAIIEAHLTGAEWAAVAPMVVGFGVELPIIPIPIHAGILERIKSEVAAFWKRIEDDDPFPPDYGRDGALIAKLYPKDNGTEIDLSSDNELPEIVDKLVAARASKSAAEADEESAKTGIKAKLGEASLAHLADGRRISFKTQRRTGYVVEDGTTRPIRILKGR
jgi:hypothetical protein